MCLIKSFTTFAVAAFCGISAMAQDSTVNVPSLEAQSLGYEPYPYGFVQIQGGVGTTFTNVDFTELLSPTASIGVGGFFTPAVGARLHVNAWESKGGFRSISDTYKFNYVNTNVDLLINLSNILSKKDNHLFNLVLLGGIGLNYAWNNDDLMTILSSKTPAESTSNAWGEGQSRTDLLSHNLRLGLLFDFNLAKHWNLGVEVDANSLNDRFNSKSSNKTDWMVTAQLSLTYKFGHKKVQKVVPPPPVIIKEEPKTVVVEKIEEPKKVEAVEEEPLKEALFYVIRGSEIGPESVIDKVVAWSKKHPTGTIAVTGYADKNTGNPDINMKYSQQRVDKVVSSLKEKGVSANLIKTKAYGDTHQPFQENDKNRCVIIEGNGTLMPVPFSKEEEAIIDERFNAIAKEGSAAYILEPVKDGDIKETLFYIIRGSEINPETVIDNVVAWNKKNPTKTIIVSGFADKGTGNPVINKRYAQQRIDKVVASLKAKGVPANIIKSNTYGDSVQPYAENDKNRCVIIVGK